MIFSYFAQNIDLGGGSIVYPLDQLFSTNIRKNVYPCTHQFYYINVGVRGSILRGLASDNLAVGYRYKDFASA